MKLAEAAAYRFTATTGFTADIPERTAHLFLKKNPGEIIGDILIIAGTGLMGFWAGGIISYTLKNSSIDFFENGDPKKTYEKIGKESCLGQAVGTGIGLIIGTILALNN